ncbi:helix-turn-helix transcriptional regulator [Sphingomonas sp. AP4-R1]|uniref:AraC family transcriptional regulator n=1 Tax=Sphingomonas sp. AP4-R1 TaxID=2735134 RepID=UPI0014932D45|nr:AraC family transcriptional regulator [Sphingomonas sp. AP4-R1]QJU58667.1 helix-turn-helix transcriptional regulator [Sphingomonas sp. AP4-R1]
MAGSYDGAIIGDRFRLTPAPTLLTRTASIAPIGFSRLRSDARHVRAKDVPPEAAYSLHVALQPTAVNLWIDGRHRLGKAASAGDAFLFDLRCNPVSELDGGFDILRFYISQDSLDELAAERGWRQAVRLETDRLGAPDPVMLGLAHALLDRVERPSERSALFVDHIGLAFHAHLTETYAVVGPPARRATGRLAPWQLRRAIDHMVAHLDGDPTIAQLAIECGLSAGHFARAFRQTAGVTPHQWLMRRRVERARELLLHGSLELALIAAACGFVDQSHFSRVFTRLEGESPGRWRRHHRN